MTVNDLFTHTTTATKPSIVATYRYHDEGGAHLFDVCRFSPKDFRQRRADGTWKMTGVRRVLYRLPELQGQLTTYVVEGEQDADRLRAIGLPGTTAPGGAGKWRPEYTQQLVAATVENIVIVADNDDAGRAHAAQVATSCQTAGLQVKVLSLPDLPIKGDVSDFLAAGGTREQIAGLVKATALYEPSTANPAAPMERPAAESAQSEFSRPAVTEGMGACVLQPTPGQSYTGWFMRGGVHLVAGSSGAGKSTLMLDLLQQAKRGGRFLGHVGARLDYLVVFADRGCVSNTETLERMGIAPGSLSMAHVPPNAHGGRSATAIIAAIEAQDPLPAVVFIEGADMLVEDASKTQIVAPFMGALRRIAEHYSLAVVLSVGAPKAKPHEQYALKRDQVFGSQAWARLANDVLVLSITGDGSVPTRDLMVLHRNAGAEKFRLSFEQGRLVEAEAQPSSDADMVSWFQEAEVFTKQRLRERFALSGARATQLLEGYVAIGVLREKVKNDRTQYVYRRPSATSTASVSGAVSDTISPPNDAPESVRKTIGHGHFSASGTDQNPNVFNVGSPNSLVSTKSLSVVRSHDSSSLSSDNGQRFQLSPHAREVDEPTMNDEVSDDDGQRY
ncbi:MAG TPA: AAA family ATPase [Vicinamibacterales bacterium]|nr:AAA family ATPase [Vicinamibacterales bacterium]